MQMYEPVRDKLLFMSSQDEMKTNNVKCDQNKSSRVLSREMLIQALELIL